MKADRHKTELYQLAYQCHELKRKGCRGYCGNCQLNVSLYADDSREAVLIKTNAAIDNEKNTKFDREQDYAYYGQGIVGLGIIIFIIISIQSCMHSCGQPSKTAEVRPRPAVTSTVESVSVKQQSVNSPFNNTQQNNEVQQQNPPSQTVEKIELPGNKNNHISHLEVLYYLQRNVYDINGDGLINCIDYAVIFKMKYGKECRIIQNNNPQTGMNHLFNAIPAQGYGWVYIEPQGDPKGKYIMIDVWGSRYDPYFNIDVTSQYARDF